MNTTSYLNGFQNATIRFYRYLTEIINTQILEYQDMLKGIDSKCWEKKHSQYDGTFYGGVSIITLDGSKNIPDTNFKFHQILYGPCVSSQLHEQLYKCNEPIDIRDIIVDVIRNKDKCTSNEYYRYRFSHVFQYIKINKSPFHILQTELYNRGILLTNETNENDVSICLKLYTYIPYFGKPKKSLWHHQNYIYKVTK